MRTSLSALVIISVSPNVLAQPAQLSYVRIDGSGVFRSQLDNPKVLTEVLLGNGFTTEEAFTGEDESIDLYESYNFEMALDASAPSPDPLWFGAYDFALEVRNTTYGRDPEDLELDVEQLIYGPNQLLPLETRGVMLGTTPIELAFSKFFSRAPIFGGAETFVGASTWQMEGDTILIPVSMYVMYREGDEPVPSLSEAMLMFDDVPEHEAVRSSNQGNPELYRLIADRRLSEVDRPDGYDLKGVVGSYRPDDVFAQCGIQFRLVEYKSIEVPAAVYEGMMSERDFDTDAPDCLLNEDDLGPDVTGDARPICIYEMTSAEDACSESLSYRVGSRAAFNSVRQNVVTGASIPARQNVSGPNGAATTTLKVVVTGSIRPDGFGACQSGPLYGNSLPGGRWVTLAQNFAARAPTTLSHEIGHVLQGTDLHVAPGGADQLMQAGSGNGVHIAGCSTWTRTGFTDAYNCSAQFDQLSPGGLCGQMRTGARLILGTAGADNGVGPMDPLPPESRFQWRVGRWSAPQPASFTTSRFTAGTHSLVVPSGYRDIASPAFITASWPEVGTEISVDVYVPSTVPNPWWVGSIALTFDNPSSGNTNIWLGEHDLTNLPRGAWSTVTFQVPTGVRNALLGDHPSAQFFFSTNTTVVNEVLLDNFRFGGTLTTRTVLHQVGSQGIGVNSSSLLSFENLSDWSSQSAVLASSTVRVSDGFQSLVVPAGPWKEIVSRQFTTSELPTLGDELSIDVFVPDPQPNPWWVGDVQFSMNCPAAGIYNAYIGQAQLSNLFVDEFNRLSFTLPAYVRTALAGSYSGCQVSFALTSNSGSEAFAFDRLGFR